MTATWEKKEGNQGVLSVTVPAKKVDQAIDQAFKKVVKQVNIPGFRKGKVPRQIFEQRFGVEALYQDAVDILLPEAYGEAIEETGIKPVDQPEIEVNQIEKGKDLKFDATVTVQPEVKLGEYKGLEIEKQNADLTDEELQEAIDHSLGHLAEMVIKEDGSVEEGDTVNIDFDGYVDGEQFEGGQAESYDLEIGSGMFIPGFEEQLVGLKTGDEKDVKVTFPEEYHAEELAGKEATFKVKINEIKYKNVPELDDEIANELDSDADNVEEYKENLRKRLSEEKKVNAENVEKEEAINKAVNNAEVDIPEAMINNELDRMMQEFAQRIQQSGLNLETYFQISGQDESQLREQMKDDAEERVKTNLTLNAIANAEEVEATEEDIDKELEAMSTQFNISVEDIKKTLGSTDIVKDDVRVKKVIDLLLDDAKLVEPSEDAEEESEDK
ncbi:trigger factor [Staphylococcus carnosus]|uniref:Trigger factor n=1 Tax=Staphylococcus carnosus (strain TM300) TaxID=396513 RepID=TIG_STACT|nr:trigger factor [Staphylococcus carnosus]B9DNC1.1 RecName: Full=Trigger factor; Short=TF; AltName: Full=PPIase [Staphylococcus carnosus subsp. carnosus TM300]QPT04308.1 trigger factor [Staphylococcus carnosus]UQA67033.1 trigger factor [Staphylococcus carnosus]UTB78132.1 trigger factor [Staphylococcus carnosus]UTB87679.1 trigger factor [Staphylococcus carnosus]UTB90030.1 trigger factor [Staphylococcus carnosus]